MILDGINSKKGNLVFLTLGMFSMSQAGILIKLANASIYSVAFYRVFFASLIIFLFSYKEILNSLKTYCFKDFLLFLCAGFFLSLHFISWNYAFTMESVSKATIVISTSPIFVALGAYLLYKEKPNKSFYPALLLSFIGLFFVTYSRIIMDDTSYLGTVFLFISTLSFVFYFLIAKKLRPKVRTEPYLFNIYFSSAIFSFIAYLIFDDTFLYHSSNNYLFYLLLAIFPTIVGHGSVNHTVKYFKASTVSMNQLVQPFFASIVAYFVLSEAIYYTNIIGYVFIIAGIFVLFKGIKNVK